MSQRWRLRRAAIVGGIGAAIVAPAAFLSCSNAGHGPEQIGVAQQAITSVGGTCDAGADAGGVCTTNGHCWILDNPDGSILQQRCHCDPGYTACDGGCVAIKNDSLNCGYCGKSCGGGTCVNGLCGGSLPDASWTVHAGSVDNASAVGSGVATWAHEGTQEMSLTTGISFGLVNYGDENDAGPGGAKWNSTDAGNTAWGTDLRQLPVDAGMLEGFDSTATTSGWSGREYLASILIDTVKELDAGKDYHCLGVTSALASTFPDWGANALTCVNMEAEGWDKPSISFDVAGTTLWASAQATSGVQGTYVYKNDYCAGAIGDDGGAGCSVPFTRVVVADPGAGNRIVANRFEPGAFYATSTGTNFGTVKLHQIMSDRSERTCTVSTTADITKDTTCQYEDGGVTGDCSGSDFQFICKCGGTTTDCDKDGMTTCLRHLPSPHLALRAEADHCFLYLTWDQSVSTVDGSRTEAWIVRMDIPAGGITDGASCPTPDVSFNQPATTYGSEIQVSKTSNNVAWCYYFDDGYACNTQYWCDVATKLDFSDAQVTQVSAGSFPVVIPPLGNTFGDYENSPTIGLPGGDLYICWHASHTITSTNGVLCEGNHYNERVYCRRLQLY